MLPVAVDVHVPLRPMLAPAKNKLALVALVNAPAPVKLVAILNVPLLVKALAAVPASDTAVLVITPLFVKVDAATLRLRVGIFNMFEEVNVALAL